MPDERKVMCPWCRKQILASNWETRFTVYPGGFTYMSCRFKCECGSCTPWGDYQPDRKRALDAAYIAATATPPNRPLTLEQVESLEPKMTPIWYATINLGLLGMIEAYVAQRDPDYWMRYGMLLFARKPTPADIEAARRGHE